MHVVPYVSTRRTDLDPAAPQNDAALPPRLLDRYLLPDRRDFRWRRHLAVSALPLRRFPRLRPPRMVASSPRCRPSLPSGRDPAGVDVSRHLPAASPDALLPIAVPKSTRPPSAPLSGPTLAGPDCGERRRLATPSLPYRLRRVLQDSKGVPLQPTPDDPPVPSRVVVQLEDPFQRPRATVLRSPFRKRSSHPHPGPRSCLGASTRFDTLRCFRSSRNLRRTSGNSGESPVVRLRPLVPRRIAAERNALRRSRLARPVVSCGRRRSWERDLLQS
jgi:hypothetical protein